MSNRIHVLAIAVENYQKPAISSVAHAENDAREFVKSWQALGANPSDCVTLLSAQATRNSIESALRVIISNVQDGDTVIFFFAGHGIGFNGVSYITTHDTQPGDWIATSIPLSYVLDALRKCKTSRVMLFVDSCHSGLPIETNMRSITSAFSDEEMRSFCADSAYHVGFAACKVDEFSWSNPTLKHGIWSHYVINALQGEAADALEKGNLITGDSLRDYLAQEVPRLLRKTRTGNETQTPCIFGNATKQFIVADLKDLLTQKSAQASNLAGALKDSCFRGERGGRVRSLRGFNKSIGHYEPEEHTDATRSFIQRIGGNEAEELAKEIYPRLRDNLGYKRADLDYSYSDGYATIKTPDFDVNVWIEQDLDNPGRYRLVTEVSTFRRPAVVNEPAFLQLFTGYCDTIIVEYTKALPIKETIDKIEKIPQLAERLNFDAESTWFTLELEHPSIRIRVSGRKMSFSLIGIGNLEALLASSNTAFATLGGSGLTLLLPEAT